VTEDVVRVGEGGGLVGILSRPDPGEPAKLGVLLLDVGLTYRVGPSRLHVRLARRLAARGVPAMRFDFSGVGDSPPRRDGLPFSESGPRETVSVMDWLGREAGLERFVLVGLCSGARVAFQTAIRDERVAGIGLLNLRNLQEEEYSDLRGVAQSHDTLRALGSWSRWRRALTGKSDYRSVLRSLTSAFGKLLDRGVAAEEAREVPAQLSNLLERGTSVGFFFSEGEFGRRYLRLALGSDYDALMKAPGVSRQLIPRADHTFTSPESQRLLLDGIEAWTLGVGATR
jgi:pimeloyl-ACP methyl ester carboxylesterase